MVVTVLASGEAEHSLMLATWVLVGVGALQVGLDSHVVHALTLAHHAHISMWRAIWHGARNVWGSLRMGLTVRRNFADFPLIGYVPGLAA